MTEPEDDDADFQVPDWFWDAIEATRPHVAALEAWLVAEPKATVEQFALHYDIAAPELADYSCGIEVDGMGWSEDDMEDLCRWIVGQGRAYWQSVIDGDRTLLAAARTFLDDANHWNSEVSDPAHRGYQSPGGIARGVYWSQFGEMMDDVIGDPDYRPASPPTDAQ